MPSWIVLEMPGRSFAARLDELQLANSHGLFSGNRQRIAQRQAEFSDLDFDQCLPEKTNAILWGDSHAASLYPGLRDVLASRGLSESAL